MADNDNGEKESEESNLEYLIGKYVGAIDMTTVTLKWMIRIMLMTVT